MGELREMANQALAMGATASAAEIYAACRAFILAKVPQLEEIQSFFTSS